MKHYTHCQRDGARLIATSARGGYRVEARCPRCGARVSIQHIEEAHAPDTRLLPHPYKPVSLEA